MALSVVFMGTPAFSVPTLEAILAAGHRVEAVYTRAPKAAGRGMEERRSPVHETALSHGLAVETPRSLKSDAERDRLAALAPDVLVVVAYGLILPPAILAIPRLGAFNLHASALPRWRGAAPIQRAILAGDTSTAVMVMRMEEGLDTGDIALSAPLAIGPDETASELHDRLAAAGAPLMVEALRLLELGRLTFTPQAGEGVTYASKIEKAEARLDFGRPAAEVHARIRALSPFPGAWFELPRADGSAGERVKVLASRLAPGASGPSGTVLEGGLTIACGEGAVRLLTLQRAGRRPMSADDFLRGTALPPGSRIR